MLRNYIKTAWRSLLKNKAMFSINVLGLSIGIATCLIITLYVVDELTFDRYHQNADQIARVVLKAKIGEEIIDEAFIPAPFAEAIANDFPQVLEATRAYALNGKPKVTYGENTIRNGLFAFIDPNYFDVFTFSFLKGDPETALQKPNSLVLTETEAEKYFGSEDPMGKVLDIADISFYGNGGYAENDGLYTVTGVIEDIPRNSHFRFNHLASMASNQDATNLSFIGGSYASYLLLEKGTDLAEFESKLSGLVKQHMGDQLAKALGMPFDEFISSGNRVGLFLEPLSEIHFSKSKSERLNGGDTGNKNIVFMFGAVALFMLLIACINFMNLSTAGASKRVKEIGMRKVLGSEKKQLIFQFLTEAFISTAFAMFLGLAFFWLALPFFNDLSGKSFNFIQITSLPILAVLAVLTLLISLLSGAYPAFFMSSFRPLQALKNRFTAGSSKGVRSGLVTFQFAVSVTLIICTLVVGHQMNYIQNKDIGYDKKDLLVLRDAGRLGNNLSVFKDELLKDGRIKNITISSFIPAGPTDQNGTTVTTRHQVPQVLRTKVYKIDEEYISTLGMEVLAGRNFSKDFGSEEKNILINETAISTFGLDENPIGESLTVSTDAEGNNEQLTVIGVVKDFHAKSFHEPIEPLIMQYNPYYGMIVKTDTKDIAGLLVSMENTWNSFRTGEVFEYAFLDELYGQTYVKEANMNSILQIFAMLTIFVACLGLFGLVTFIAEQRFKEIGIRKTLGSSVPQIVGLLSKDFLKLIVISFVVAFPLGYYLMDKWLQDFEYRINIQWWVYLVAGLSTILIAFLTISYRSIKAALMNPAKSLKSE